MSTLSGSNCFGKCSVRQWRSTILFLVLICSLCAYIKEFVHIERTNYDGAARKTFLHRRNSQSQSSKINSTAIDGPGGAELRVKVMAEDIQTGDELRKRFNRGEWRSSTVSYQHHLHFAVNCSGVIQGDPETQLIAGHLLNTTGKVGRLGMPSDEVVTTWTRNCDYYKTKRKYPTEARSKEEAEYPLAYILLVHKDSAQVERLLRSIYHPQNVYCIHVDTKATADFWLAMRGMARCFDNVFIASKLENIQYRGFSRLQADINCMEDLMYGTQYRWNYVINLCGQDFPLKTNLEIVRQVKAYGGHNDIPGVYPKQDEWFISRTRNHHTVVDGNVRATKIRKPPPPHDAKLYFGNAYYVASRAFVEYILNNKTAKDILYYLEDSNSPDEHYWITMSRYPGAPGGYPYSSWRSSARFIRWTVSDEHPPCVGKYVRDVCIIGFGYLPYVTSLPHLFVNKIYYEYDPIALQCLEEMLDYRTVFPDAINDFVPVYPLTDLFPDNPPAENLTFQ